MKLSLQRLPFNFRLSLRGRLAVWLLAAYAIAVIAWVLR